MGAVHLCTSTALRTFALLLLLGRTGYLCTGQQCTIAKGCAATTRLVLQLVLKAWGLAQHSTPHPAAKDPRLSGLRSGLGPPAFTPPLQASGAIPKRLPVAWNPHSAASAVPCKSAVPRNIKVQCTGSVQCRCQTCSSGRCQTCSSGQRAVQNFQIQCQRAVPWGVVCTVGHVESVTR